MRTRSFKLIEKISFRTWFWLFPATDGVTWNTRLQAGGFGDSCPVVLNGAGVCFRLRAAVMDKISLKMMATKNWPSNLPKEDFLLLYYFRDYLLNLSISEKRLCTNQPFLFLLIFGLFQATEGLRCQGHLLQNSIISFNFF